MPLLILIDFNKKLVSIAYIIVLSVFIQRHSGVIRKDLDNVPVKATCLILLLFKQPIYTNEISQQIALRIQKLLVGGFVVVLYNSFIDASMILIMPYVLLFAIYIRLILSTHIPRVNVRVSPGKGDDIVVLVV